MSRNPGLVPQALLNHARAMRAGATCPEAVMWAILRDRRFRGLKFRRQHVVEPFILDFFCSDLAWAIELDGGQHNTADGRRHDAQRSRHLAQRGIAVTRFWNNQVSGELESVLHAMWNVSTELMEARKHPHPDPLPEGEGGEENGPLPEGEGAERKHLPEGKGKKENGRLPES